jgi:CxxC-x17-CxxC domain-containing protein
MTTRCGFIKNSQIKEDDVKKNTQQDIVEIAGKIQQQLFSLERKIDILLNRPSAGPSQAQFNQPRRDDRQRQGRDFRQRNMYKIICADCNKECEIPFKPRPDRPVYCRDCFSRRKNSGNLFKPRQENTIIERDFTAEKPSSKKKKSFGRKKKARR